MKLPNQRAMQKWETLTALVAVILASAGSIPHVPFRGVLTVAAVMLITIVGVSRLAAARRSRSKRSSSFDAAARAKIIREERSKRR